LAIDMLRAGPRLDSGNDKFLPKFAYASGRIGKSPQRPRALGAYAEVEVTQFQSARWPLPEHCAIVPPLTGEWRLMRTCASAQA